ncbi:MAG: PTS fructose transporter subunit IIA [Phycisphaerae bacterium SM23_30]|nr:MAG: PTS fructose transporter subunit IIA [Phycisphaerae bacterium SM23_30]
MKLCDFMVAEAIVAELQSNSRDAAIKELVEALARTKHVAKNKVDEIVKGLIERENQGSTGIGKGIAVPHIKHPSVKTIVGTIGCNKKGIDFSSLDNAPVYSVLLLLSPPNDPDRHLEAMESLFSHLQRDMFRKFLRQAETREMIVDLLSEADAADQESSL